MTGDSLVDYGLLELELCLARFGPSRAKPFLQSVDPQPLIRYISYHWGLNDAAGLEENYHHVQVGAAIAASGELWTKVTDWFFGLGKEYGVDPVIFGAIYVGAIPFFSLSIGWLVRNLRRGKSPVLPLLCASFCFVSAYLYLLIAGKNIPAWVYAFLAAMVVFGVVSTVRKVRSQVGKGKVHEV